MTNPFKDTPQKRSTAEFRLHIAVVEHLRSAFPSVLFTHPANETRSKADAYWNKVKGARKGTPDLLLWWCNSNPLPGVTLKSIIISDSGRSITVPIICAGAIELKSAKGKHSGWQANFDVIFTEMGGKFAYCRSVREVHDILVSWGCTPKHNAIKEPDLRSDQQKFSDVYDFYAP